MATASLTWLDLTAADRDKVRRVLDLFNEQGTVDELGLGSLRDTISNTLFPGTSVLHTRLRYVLFIRWIYQELESWGPGYDVAHHARELETQLIYSLAESDDPHGVIGIEAGESLARLASNAYSSPSGCGSRPTSTMPGSYSSCRPRACPKAGCRGFSRI